MAAALLAGVAAAQQPLPPSLVLTNRSDTLAVSWLELVHAHAQHYWVRLTVSRPLTDEVTHVTRQAAYGTHVVEWPDLPDDAVSCFQVGVTDDNMSAHPVYSEKSCYFGCKYRRIGSEQARGDETRATGCFGMLWPTFPARAARFTGIDRYIERPMRILLGVGRLRGCDHSLSWVRLVLSVRLVAGEIPNAPNPQPHDQLEAQASQLLMAAVVGDRKKKYLHLDTTDGSSLQCAEFGSGGVGIELDSQVRTAREMRAKVGERARSCGPPASPLQDDRTKGPHSCKASLLRVVAGKPSIIVSTRPPR